MRSEMRSAADEILIRRFFLGDLSEEDRDRIEDEYFGDPERYQEFLAAENDLVDAYVRGKLAKDENRKFETAYLGTPERREKVEFARALNTASANANETLPARTASFWRRLWEALSVPHRMPRWALATSIAGLATLGSWLIVSDHNLRAGLQFARARQAQLQHEEVVLRQQSAEIEGVPGSSDNGGLQHFETANSASRSESLVVLSLVPGGVRGPGTSLPSIRLPHVQLLLILDQDNYKTYKAELQTADGGTVLQSGALHSQNQDGKMLVAWKIPAQAVQPGDYIVQLKGLNERGGLEDVESYSFRALGR
jgi:hypothetical protein